MSIPSGLVQIKFLKSPKFKLLASFGDIDAFSQAGRCVRLRSFLAN
jgi:hypothetical protein